MGKKKIIICSFKINPQLRMFEFTPYFSYTDFDECQPFKSSCHFDAECINTEGSYDCRCRPGYLGDGFDCACKFC